MSLINVDGGKLTFKFHDGQIRAWESTAQIVAIIAGNQSGKALDVHTPITTSDGFVEIGDVKVGDVVRDEDGTQCHVTHAHPVMLHRPCFRVVVDGGSVVADKDHLWSIRSMHGRANVTTETLRGLVTEGHWPVLCGRLGRVVRWVEPVPSVPVRCLTVDSESRTYLCGEALIPTHNTTFGPPWLWREICNRGPGEYIVAAPTYPLLERKAIPEFLKLFDKTLRLGTKVGGVVSKFTFSPDGEKRTFGSVQDEPTVVYFIHASDPDSLESLTVKGVWLDEAGQYKFRLPSWEALQRRIAVYKARVLISTTPYTLNWLKQQVYDKWKGGDKRFEVIQFSSTENPVYDEEEFARAKRELPRWKFDMFYRGVFTRPAGMIYDVFDPETMTCPSFTIPESWPRYLGLDFGGTNTAGIFLAAEPRTERVFAYREYAAGRRTAKQHVAALLANEPMTPICVGGSGSEDQWRDEFRAAGLPVMRPAVTDVEVGITRVYGAMARNELTVFDTLTNLLDELGSYSRVTGEDGEPTEAIKDKNDYHGADAIRYIGSWLKKGGWKPHIGLPFDRSGLLTRRVGHMH